MKAGRWRESVLAEGRVSVSVVSRLPESDCVIIASVFPMKLFTAFRAVGLAGLIAASFTFRLLAQDVIVTSPQWSNPANPFADELPTITKHPEINYPATMADKEPGYALHRYWLSDEGVVIRREFWASHPAFAEAGQLTTGYEFKPAAKEGAPVDAPAWHAIIFNPDSASEQGRNVRPRLLAVAPVFADRADLEGVMPGTEVFFTVWGSVKISAQGELMEFTIQKRALEKFRPQIQEALTRWRFAPAREKGEPVACKLDVAFALTRKPGKNAPRETNYDTPAKAIKQVGPVYPFGLKRSRQSGSVILDFTVDESGKTSDISVKSSDHPLFEAPAMEALAQWKYQPAMKDGKPVKARFQISMSFSLDGQPARGAGRVDELSKKQMDKLPEELRYDVPPRIKGMLYPAYPYELLVDKVGGEAEVAFLVGVNGRVSKIKVLKADRPEFGEALVAAMAAYEFVPASRGGKPVMTLHTMKHRFDPSGVNGRPSDEDLSVLSVIRKHPERILSPKLLDAPPKPISQRRPVMPSTATAAEGSATIEIIIDKEGRACLPRVVKASEPVFGYAAAQAVTDWRFEKPLSQGKAVMVRVAVPVHFEPTKTSPQAPKAAPESVEAPAAPSTGNAPTEAPQPAPDAAASP
jgi:TonB family protein